MPKHTKRQIIALLSLTLISLSFVLLKSYAHWSRGLISDENAYFFGSADIAKNGLLSKWIYGDIRTYLYPLLIAVERWVLRLSSDGSLRFAIVTSQFVAYVGVAWFAAKSISRQPLAIFAVLVLNIWNLIYVTQVLTETASLVFIMLNLVAMRSVLKEDRLGYSRIFGLGLLVGAAVMIRSANLFLLFAVASLFVLRLIRKPETWQRTTLAFGIVILSASLMTLPQLSNNIVFYQKPTPLLANSLGSDQLSWGIKIVKYATGVENGQGTPVCYRNPFASDADLASKHVSLSWYLQHPVGGVATVALKVFNLFDQDLPLPYNPNLNPWYRIPAGVLNHLFLFVSLFGLWIVWRNRSSEVLHRGTSETAISFVIFGIGLYAMTAVEGRFGLPFITLLSLFIPDAWLGLRQFSSSKRLAAGFIAFSYVVCALCLSEFVHRQITAGLKL